MSAKLDNHNKLKLFIVVSVALIALAGLTCWHIDGEYRLVEQLGARQAESFAGSWHSTIYSEVVIGGLIMLLVATLFFLFIRQVKKLENANLKLLSQQDELQLKAEMLGSALDAIMLLDEQGTLLHFNNALCSLTGRSRQELEGVRIQDFMPPERGEQVKGRIRQIMSSGRAVFVSEYLHASGTIVPIEGHAKSVEIGQRQLVLSVVRDISAHRIFEETLKRVASEWRDTFDSVTDVVWLLDMNKRVLRANAATLPVFGKSPKEIIGRSCCEIAHNQFFSNAGCPFEQMKSSGKHVSVLANVSSRWFEVSIDPVMSSEGVMVNAVHIVKDITALKKTEQRERLRAEILERIAGNEALAQILSFIVLAMEKESPESLCSIMLVDEQGEYLTSGVAPSLPEDYNQATSRVRIAEGVGTCGTAAFRRERVVVEDINTHPFWKGFMPAREAGLRSCWSEPVLSSTGELLGTFGIYYRTQVTPGEEDIHQIQQAAYFAAIAIERNRNAQEREHLENLLNQSQKMEAIGHLAGGIAHDFNNLLTPIIIYSDMIKRALPADKNLQSKIDGIINASHKARDLTQQLLSFGRKQVMQMQVQDLNVVISEFFSIMRRTLRENVDIKLELAGQPAMINADRSKLEQVLLNLAINAQDAIAENGVIRLETGMVMVDDEYARLHPGMKTGRYIMMSFSDNGSGMSDETLRHIFEPFFTTKQAGQGTGLGLANVYGIVKQHNASISVLSKPGRGTTFNVYFPLSRETQKPVELKAESTESVWGGVGTILLVEDNEMVRLMICELLEGYGYRVLVADHPEKALEIIRNLSTDIELVITDVVMPGMNGKQLYDRISTERPEIDKVLFISGYDNNIIVSNGVLEEGLHFLQKPFKDEALMSKVLELMNPGSKADM